MLQIYLVLSKSDYSPNFCARPKQWHVVQDFIMFNGSYPAVLVKLSICVIGFHSQALLSKGGLRYGNKRLPFLIGLTLTCDVSREN